MAIAWLEEKTVKPFFAEGWDACFKIYQDLLRETRLNSISELEERASKDSSCQDALEALWEAEEKWDNFLEANVDS